MACPAASQKVHRQETSSSGACSGALGLVRQGHVVEGLEGFRGRGEGRTASSSTERKLVHRHLSDSVTLQGVVSGS